MPMPDYVRHLRAKIGNDMIMSPSASAVVLDDQGRVLLQKRTDTGTWSLPGGMMEPGEEPAQAAIREVQEETGLQVIPERLTGVYGGPANSITYPNGDQVSFVSMCFLCRVVGGEMSTDDDETLDVRFFAPDELPDSLFDRHRLRIEHALKDADPYFALPED